MLLAGCARYLFALALRVEGRPQRPLDPSPFRRRLAGFQMGLLAVCLVPGITLRWSVPAAFALGVPFLVGFARDYLVSSGRLDPAGVPWLGRLRKPAALTAVGAAVPLAALGLGPLALGAFLFAWLLTPAVRRRSRSLPRPAG